ncbi:hypothetical protein [Pseudomonas bubulae]|uniref:hypothetical protein n=1 Tax=Pseudomonas bubulae TaxID=2316085 RepID=UPI00399F5171
MTAKVEKITIKGVPPQYDPSRLEELVTAAKQHYMNSTQCCIVVRSGIGKEFLQLVADNLNQGCTISPYPLNLGPINFNCHLIKSPELQAIDLAQNEVDVKAQYIKSLESEHVRHKELLLAQLIQTEELKAAKKAEQAKEKLLLELKRQVEATYTPLAIPK